MPDLWRYYSDSTPRRDTMAKVRLMLGQWLAPNGQVYDHYRPPRH